MENELKRKCACCGFFAIIQDWDTCPVCNWEQDFFQEEHIYDNGGPNSVSLLEARKNYKIMGAVEERYIKCVRAPLPDEMR